MTRLELLIDDATNLGIIVDEKMLPRESQLDGLYLHWQQISLTVILLNSYRPACVQLAVMAEELGHFRTCAGNALDQRMVNAVKTEMAGRTDAYRSILPARKLKAALCSGTCTLWELSESFGLPESFINDAFEYYSRAGDLRLGDAECHWCYAV
ncbi:MAG: hypothetical protein PHI98_01340 [Eubacteriales bacterium]|nr:hypothetical protein [Eubacteriales bacterium]